MRVPIQRMVLVVAAVVLFSPAARAQLPRPSLGPQGGFASNHYDAFIGAQIAFPVTPRVDIYPSLDIYFPGNSTTAWALNADVRFWPRLQVPNPGLFVGGGLSYTHASVDVLPFGTVSSSDTVLGLLGGWDFKAVSWRPFVQLRIVIGDADRVEFGGGVNFRI